jgi:hypothetical protein
MRQQVRRARCAPGRRARTNQHQSQAPSALRALVDSRYLRAPVWNAPAQIAAPAHKRDGPTRDGRPQDGSRSTRWALLYARGWALRDSHSSPAATRPLTEPACTSGTRRARPCLPEHNRHRNQRRDAPHRSSFVAVNRCRRFSSGPRIAGIDHGSLARQRVSRTSFPAAGAAILFFLEIWTPPPANRLGPSTLHAARDRRIRLRRGNSRGMPPRCRRGRGWRVICARLRMDLIPGEDWRHRARPLFASQGDQGCGPLRLRDGRPVPCHGSGAERERARQRWRPFTRENV